MSAFCVLLCRSRLLARSHDIICQQRKTTTTTRERTALFAAFVRCRPPILPPSPQMTRRQRPPQFFINPASLPPRFDTRKGVIFCCAEKPLNGDTEVTTYFTTKCRIHSTKPRRNVETLCYLLNYTPKTNGIGPHSRPTDPGI